MAELETLQKEIEANVQDALKAHRGNDISPQILRTLAAGERTPSLALFLASYPDTPSRILEELFEQDETPEVLVALADNPRTPKTIIQQLAKHDNPVVRRGVASSKSISPQAARIILDDANAEIRAALAENTAIPLGVQMELSDDSVPFVRSALVKQGARLEPEALEKLATDDMDPTVQASALLSQHLSAEAMLQCADSDEHFPQRMLLMRRNLPDKVLESLCFSTRPDIQKEAVARKTLTLDEMVGFSTRGDVEVRLKIASMPNLPDIVQIELAKDSSKEVRLALARCPILCTEAAQALTADQDDDLVVAVASNMNVPMEALLALAGTGNRQVLKSLAAHQCPQEILDIIYATDDDDVLFHLAYNDVIPHGMPNELMVRLADHKLPTLRKLAASCPTLPLYLMSRLARDDNAQVRLAIASNEKASPSALELLAEDANAKVRAAAAETMELQAEQAQAEKIAADQAAALAEEQAATQVEQTETKEPEEEPESGVGSLFKRILKRVKPGKPKK